ncbi:hypothetical protein BDZ97DRAFT_75560 [Flammula alnicola]|nr:hypothetical protein BDZ97DRAFT_75560 [Flammula alnicola]
MSRGNSPGLLSERADGNYSYSASPRSIRSSPGLLSERMDGSGSAEGGDGHDEVDTESDADRALKQHMAHFPERFASIPINQRIQWAQDNLPEEWVQHEEKRKTFEDDRAKWLEEKAAIEAANLLQIQKEIVRVWMKSENFVWAKERADWDRQRRELEENLKAELQWLRNMVQSDGTINYARPPVSVPSWGAPARGSYRGW